MVFEVAQGLSEDDETPAINPAGIVFGMMVSVIVAVIVRSREREERRETLRRRKNKEKHRSKKKKSSKIERKSSSGMKSNCVNEFKEDQMWISEKDLLLERQMVMTLDQDLTRYKPSDPLSERAIDCDPKDDSRNSPGDGGGIDCEDDFSNGGGLGLGDLFECETADFMAEFEFDGSADALFIEVKLAIWESFGRR